MYGYICSLWRPISTTITRTIFVCSAGKIAEILLVVLFPEEAELIWSLDTVSGQDTMSLQTWIFVYKSVIEAGGRSQSVVVFG